MDIRLDIFAGAVSTAINSAIQYIDIDVDCVVNSAALAALNEIRGVIQNTDIEDDFDVVEEIVCIFEKYNISAGGRHDF